MSEIVEFIEARIAEDEELARELETEARRGGPARVDPYPTGADRLLADCAAKRGLLELAAAAGADGLTVYEEAIHRLLAAPYAEHADYLDAWRP